MAARTLPNLGLRAFYDLGEDGWKDDQDLGLLKLSVLVQATALDLVDTLPGAPVDGDVYILDETAVANANDIAIYDDAAWVYVTPQTGWLIFDQAEAAYRSFDGTVWAVLETGGGGGAAVSVVTTVAGAATNLTAAQVGLYLRYTSVSAKTVTVQNNATEAMPDNGEWHIRNVGASDLTLVEDTAVTIHVPNGGTLVVPIGGTVTLKRVAVDEYDLLGQTVAA